MPRRRGRGNIGRSAVSDRKSESQMSLRSRRRSASVTCSHFNDEKNHAIHQKRKSSEVGETSQKKKPFLDFSSSLMDHTLESHNSVQSSSSTNSPNLKQLLHQQNVQLVSEISQNACPFNSSALFSTNEHAADEDSESASMSQSDISMSEAVAQWITLFQEMNGDDKISAMLGLVDNCSINQIRYLKSVIEPYFQKDFISELPREIALHVMSFLSPSDLARISLTCRYWRVLADSNHLWKKKCKEMNVSIMEDPSTRKYGAWRETASTSGIEIVGYQSVESGQNSSNAKYTNEIKGAKCSEETKNVCFSRSKWKAVYLRNCRIEANWRSRPLRGSCILRGHDEHVITCLLIRDDLIITGSDDNTLKVWSVSKAQCMHTLFGHSGGVWSSQMSEDGAIVISGSTDRTVRVWSVRTGRCLYVLQGHTSTVRCMALKNYVLVTGSRDTTLRIWNINRSEVVRVLLGHIAAVRCVQFDGKKIISGAYDYSVKVWDAETGTCIHTLTEHSNRVYSLLFDSERDIVVSGSLDTTIKVWNIRTGKCMQTLIGHQSLTSGMQLRGNTLVSGNADSTIKVWDISNGQCKFTLSGPNRHASAVTSLQFLDNDLVATSSDDGSVKLWDVNQGSFVRDLVHLHSGGSGGCIWRLKSTPTMLVCAVGSRNGTEDTKLILLDFDSDYP